MPLEHIEKTIRSEPLEQFYDVGAELGRGKFAIVKRCTSKSTRQQFAVKVLKKRRGGRSVRNDILVEIDIMRQAMEHQRIVKLSEVFEGSKEFYIVIELATGGELFRMIAIEPLKEDKAREVVYQIVDGVQHLHNLNIVHLDLKPENILLYRKGQLDIKIADFGLAVQLKEGEEMKNLVGTAEYVAPEILNYDPFSTFSDLWSIGALTYALLTGYSPFQGETHQETFLNVSTCDYDFEDEVFDDVSQDAKDFIEKLLIKQPKKRLTATKCLQHPWMKGRKASILNSSTSSIDSALCMESSASSLEPSPVSSASSSFSPAPSSTSRSSGSTVTSRSSSSTVTTATSSTVGTSYSQPEDMREVNEKLSQISTLATDRMVAEIPPAAPRREGSPTSTDSSTSTSTLKGNESSENIPALVRGTSVPPTAVAAAVATSPVQQTTTPPEGTDGKNERVQRRGSVELSQDTAKEAQEGTLDQAAGDSRTRDGLLSRRSRGEPLDRRAAADRTRDIYATMERRPRDYGRAADRSQDGSLPLVSSRGREERSRTSERRRRDGSLERKIDRLLGREGAEKKRGPERERPPERERGTERGGSAKKSSDAETEKSRDTVQALEERSRPDSQTERSRPDSQTERSHLDSRADLSRPDSQTERSHLDSRADLSRPDSQTERSRPDSQTERSRPDSQTERSHLDSRADLSRPNSRAERSRPGSRADTVAKDYISLDPKTVESLERYQRLKHHRPVTPEPTSPHISETKLQVSPERRLRRKSEGMKPIEKKVTPDSLVRPPPLVREEEEEEEEEEEKAGEGSGREELGQGRDETTPIPELRMRIQQVLSPEPDQLNSFVLKSPPGRSAEDKSTTSAVLGGSDKGTALPLVSLSSPSPVAKTPPVVLCTVSPEDKPTPGLSSSAMQSTSPPPPGGERDAVESKPHRVLSSTVAFCGGQAQLRQRSPVPDWIKVVKGNRRKTPVISTDAVDAILRGEIVDDDEEVCFVGEEGEEEGQQRSREGSPLVTHHTLETCVEEDEGLPVHTPSHAPSAARADSPEKKGLLPPTLRGGARSGSPEKRERRVQLAVDTRTKSTSDASPERSNTRYDHESHNSLSASHSGGVLSNQMSRFRSSSMSFSQSTPDLSQIMAGSSTLPGRRVERSNSRRRMGRTRQDSYLSTSTTSPTHSSSSPTTRARAHSTLPSRFSFGISFTKSRDKDRKKGRRS